MLLEQAALALLGISHPAAPADGKPFPNQEPVCDLASVCVCPHVHPRNCQYKCLHLPQHSYV